MDLSAVEAGVGHQLSPSHWEELRRRARQLESDLDGKLFSFSKLLNNTRSSDSRLRKPNAAFESEPLIGTEDNFERLSYEIDSLLTSLRDVNGQMAQYCASAPGNSAVVQHTLQRHQEILKDHTNEFHKTRATVEGQLTRERLLGSSTSSTTTATSRNGLNGGRSNADLSLLKEHESIHSSEILIDEQINVAMRTRDTLRGQRSAMKSIQKQLNTLANTFPLLNSVMHRINVKKRKDSIIIALVIGICLFLLLIYIF